MNQKLARIIKSAIVFEKESYRLYKVGQQRASGAGSKGLFSRLMREELKHRKGLEALLRDKTLKVSLPRLRDLKIVETMTTAPLSEFDELVQIIGFAVRKEIAAQKRYRRMARLFAGKARLMIQIFEKQEKSHEIMLRNEKRKMG